MLIKPDRPVPGIEADGMDALVAVRHQAEGTPPPELSTYIDRHAAEAALRGHDNGLYLPQHRSVVLDYGAGMSFAIAMDGNSIDVLGHSPADDDLARAMLLGPVLALALRFQGFICLHASVVAVDRGAIALLGPSEAGKSTAAAALARRGHPLLSDDILVVDGRGKQPIAIPHMTGLRLWPNALEQLSLGGNDWPRQVTRADKRVVDPAQAALPSSGQALPLRSVYTRIGEPGEGEGFSCHAVSPHPALATLMQCRYPSRLYPVPSALDKQEFNRLARLLDAAPLRGLKYQRSMARLDEMVQLIERDATTGLPTA